MSEPTISVEDFKKAIEAEYQPTTTIDWRGLSVQILHHLSLPDMVRFAGGVVSACFLADTGEYIPEMKDFMIRCSILEYYAGFELPKDLEAKYDLVYSSDIVSCVVQYVDGGQFNALCEAIDKKIAHIAQSNIEALNKQFEEVVVGLDTLEKKLSNTFGGVDGDTISKVAGAIANGSFDEKKLVQAFKESGGDEKHSGNVTQMPKSNKKKGG